MKYLLCFFVLFSLSIHAGTQLNETWKQVKHHAYDEKNDAVIYQYHWFDPGTMQHHDKCPCITGIDNCCIGLPADFDHLLFCPHYPKHLSEKWFEDDYG